jgi:hypothetical protein
VAFTATSKAAVDNAYTAALANDGADSGPRDHGPSPVIATMRRICWIRTATAWSSTSSRGFTKDPTPFPAGPSRSPTEGGVVRVVPWIQGPAGAIRP